MNSTGNSICYEDLFHIDTEKYRQLNDSFTDKIAKIICTNMMSEKKPKKETQYSKMKIEVPIYEKNNLTLEEASAYFNIGINKLREITNEDNCGFVLWIGSKRLIKRVELEQYLAETISL